MVVKIILLIFIIILSTTAHAQWGAILDDSSGNYIWLSPDPPITLPDLLTYWQEYEDSLWNVSDTVEAGGIWVIHPPHWVRADSFEESYGRGHWYDKWLIFRRVPEGTTTEFIKFLERKHE